MLENEVSRYAEKRRRTLDIAVLFLLTFLLATFVIQAVNQTFLFTVRVEGSSMHPTLKNGDVVGVSRTAAVKRGSIVVINAEDGKPLIKRVIAFGGETVWSVHGVVYISSEGGMVTVSEPYVAPENAGGADIARITVPEGHVFVMGDNRAISLDSRSFGPLPKTEILGVVTEFWLKHKM